MNPPPPNRYPLCRRSATIIDNARLDGAIFAMHCCRRSRGCARGVGGASARGSRVIRRAMEAEVLRLHHAEKWPVGTIARQLMLHHSTVRRVLAQAGVPEAQKTTRPSMADPFIPFMLETLNAYPKLCASRLYIMVRDRGYRGGSDHFRAIVARLRPRPVAEAYLRLRTLAGQQAQCDWAHFGSIKIGKATRPLMAFVMVLSYSRHLFLRFYLNAAMNNFLRGHVEAFTGWGAVRGWCCMTTFAVQSSSGEAMQSASIRRSWSWPLIIGSNHARWRLPGGTKKGAWNEQYVLFEIDFLQPVSSKISAI